MHKEEWETRAHLWEILRLRGEDLSGLDGHFHMALSTVDMAKWVVESILEEE
jgi:hypothetical protein